MADSEITGLSLRSTIPSSECLFELVDPSNTTMDETGTNERVAWSTIASAFQPIDADLTALAALSGTNNLYYRSGASTWSSVTIGTALDFNGGTLSATRTGVVRDLWLDAGFFEAAPTNGAATGIATYSTNNLAFRVFEFDQTTEESIICKFKLPDSYNNGTIKFKAKWTAASGSGGVAIGLCAGALSNDDAIDSALGTEVTVTDTLIATSDEHTTDASAAVTIAGSPTTGDTIVIKVSRKVANGSDTLNADLRLIGIAIQYTESSTEPSAW